MKITRKHLHILIENFLYESEEEKQTARDAMLKGFKSSRKNIKKREMLSNMQDYGKFANPDDFDTMADGQFGTGFDDYNTEQGVNAKELRRKAKKTWNENADHNFFKSKIAKLHQTGYAGGAGDAISTSYLSGGGKTELSAWGIKSNTPLKPTVEEMYNCANPEGYRQSFSKFYLILDGRVTWAGNFDAYTEELGSHRSAEGTKDYEKRQVAIQQTKSSGIPKRPGAVRLHTDMAENLREFPILLDEEDVDGLSKPLINEMIVDNWKIHSLTFFTSTPVYSLKNNSIKDIADWCNDFKQDRGKNTPYHQLKEAIAAGYPVPRVCDYLTGRYWTDQEIQQIFSLLK